MKINATTSQLATALLELKGNKLTFDKYKPFATVYDMDPPMLIGKAGRQIGKSVGIAGITTIKSISRPYFNSLYIAPLSQQTKRFSTMYLDMFLDSPLIAKHYRDKASTKNVFEKSFTTGSIAYLGYAQDEGDADRIRGIMADSLTVDEVQDISYDALPPIFEILSASEYGFKRLFGTSKSTSNTLEYLWLKSNQLEWVIKCPHCSKWTVPADYETCFKICSNKNGPACAHCDKVINVEDGMWASMSPNTKNIVGFHLPQFSMSANTSKKKWGDLYEKIHNGIYTPVKIANEVFGLATDLAGKSITMKEAQDCSDSERHHFDEAWPSDNRGILNVVVGVDWSVTGSEKSFTVVSVLGYSADGKCHVMYVERFQGIDILKQVAQVLHLYVKYGANIIASDRGVGVLQVQLLQKELGHNKVLSVQYVTTKTKLKWNTPGQFLAADRTQAIDNVVMKIRLGRTRFESPRWELMERYWQDALNIYEEESASGNRLYRHHPDEPDDWLHSLVFGNIGYQFITGDYTFTE